MSFTQSVNSKAIDLVRKVIEMTTEAGSGHPSSASSLAHIVTVLLYHQMQFEPLQPDHPVADRLILSEGHACPIVYAAGADLGFAVDDARGRRAMDEGDLHHLREDGSPLQGHPDPRAGFPFFPTATGSLGQGLSMAAGMALAARLDAVDKRIYCIIGDGESREGQVWEALDLLIDERLRSVCPVFNCNGLGQNGRVSTQQSAAMLTTKLQAFGFDARRVDGHDPEALRTLFAEQARREDDRPPIAVVASTKKGWGTVHLAGDMHGKALSGEAAEAALHELDDLKHELGAHLDPRDLRRREELPSAPAVARQVATPSLNAVPGFDEALGVLDREALRLETHMATRQGHGIALQMLGRLRPDLVVLDGDVANSTCAQYFAGDGHVNQRFVDCRIGEQNMLSCAVGLAAAGKLPFISCFGRFLTRGFDQLEMAVLGGAALKLVGSHAGLTASADGPSQMALADVAFCRALGTVDRDDDEPLLYVLTPCDARAAYGLTVAMAAHPGTCYLRTQRVAVPHLYGDGQTFAPGGMNVLIDGSDLLLVGWGHLLHACAEAVRQLQDRGVHATLVDAYSLPFERGRMLSMIAANGGHVLTVEDNYRGGLGSAVAELMATAGNPGRIDNLVVKRLPHSARRPETLQRRLGLAVEDIVHRAQRLVTDA